MCFLFLNRDTNLGQELEMEQRGFPQVLSVNILICTGLIRLRSKSSGFILSTFVWPPSKDGAARAWESGEFDGNSDLNVHRGQSPSEGVKKQKGRTLIRDLSWWASLHLLQHLDLV